MSVQYLTNTRSRYSDGTGKPLSQGTVGVYVAGTSFGTLATIWDTVTKDTELPNPVTLDDAGEAEIWYDVEVDIQLKDSAGALQDTALGLDPNANETAQTGFNLATNGSFEIDSNNDGQPDSWTIAAYDESSIAVTNEFVTHGTAALEFNTDTAGSGGGSATSSKFPVTEGSVVSVSWSFYATHASTTNQFFIYWYDESGALTGFPTTLTMPASGAVPTSWTNYQEEITANSGATQGEIFIVGISSGGSNLSAQAYFDGISVINDESLVTLTGTQTLTNKTLTAPNIDAPVLTKQDAVLEGGQIYFEGATASFENIVVDQKSSSLRIFNQINVKILEYDTSTGELTKDAIPIYGMVMLDTPLVIVNGSTTINTSQTPAVIATLSNAKAKFAILNCYSYHFTSSASATTKLFLKSGTTAAVALGQHATANSYTGTPNFSVEAASQVTVKLDAAYKFSWYHQTGGTQVDSDVTIYLAGYYT